MPRAVCIEVYVTSSQQYPRVGSVRLVPLSRCGTSAGPQQIDHQFGSFPGRLDPCRVPVCSEPLQRFLRPYCDFIKLHLSFSHKKIARALAVFFDPDMLRPRGVILALTSLTYYVQLVSVSLISGGFSRIKCRQIES